MEVAKEGCTRNAVSFPPDARDRNTEKEEGRERFHMCVSDGNGKNQIRRRRRLGGDPQLRRGGWKRWQTGTDRKSVAETFESQG